jgi:hypothetical protein
MLLIAAAMWTAMVEKSADVNKFIIPGPGVPLGIVVSTGPGLYLLWGAFACLAASTLPYLIRSAHPDAVYIVSTLTFDALAAVRTEDDGHRPPD